MITKLTDLWSLNMNSFYRKWDGNGFSVSLKEDKIIVEANLILIIGVAKLLVSVLIHFLLLRQNTPGWVAF